MHRDLKPENILLDGNCHIKITDFGDSKVIDVEKAHEKILSPTYSVDGAMLEKEPTPTDFDDNFGIEGEIESRKDDRGDSFVGTPLYVSPEMLNHNIACYASDLWALGCILYQCA